MHLFSSIRLLSIVFCFLGMVPFSLAATVDKTIGLSFKHKTVYISPQINTDVFTWTPIANTQLQKNTIAIAHSTIKTPFQILNWSFQSQKEDSMIAFTHTNALQSFLKRSSLIDESEKQDPVRIYTKSDGTVAVEGTPYEGFLVDLPKLVHRINMAMMQEVSHVEVPYRHYFSRPIVEKEIQEKHGIYEIIAIGKSDFSGSSEKRIQNITRAAEKIKGTFIPHNKTFSFNKTIQSITKADGFAEENVIKGNTTVKEVGGGVCEVSTAVFRSAFFGGLPIPERSNHSLALESYLPHGIDAAIYLGVKDLQFQNDTPGDILLDTFVDDDEIHVVLYGKKDGRIVHTEGPFVSHVRNPQAYLITNETDLPQRGFHTQWIRRIAKDNESHEEFFTSIYRPWVQETVVAPQETQILTDS